MSDDQSGPVDTIGPWTLKAVPTETRQTVIRAAQRENLTVGQWLELRVREWTEGGSPVAIAQPHRSATGDLAIIERTVEAAARLASASEVPKALRGKLNKLLREGLPAGEVREKRPRVRIGFAPQPNGEDAR
jgi:hypothetical protein